MNKSLISESDKTFIRDMPKTELHLHLEGAIPLYALMELIEKYEGKGYITKKELEKRFAYSNFANFIKTWYWKNSFIREYDDYEFIAENVAVDLANQNISYAEIYFSPSDFRQFDPLPQEITVAIRKGLNKYSDKITINLIADLVRDDKNKMPQLSQITEVKDEGVIGIGLGGLEKEYPPKLFIEVFNKAKRHGFKTTCHAGEAAGADYIWQAVNKLKVDRIGHGTRATEDEKLIEYLIEKQIPVEMNPISNVRTNVVDSLDKHPIIDFYRRGVLVSVNTDDPKMFHTSMEQEYTSLLQTFNLNKTDIINLAVNSIASLWCDESAKVKLLNELKIYNKKHLN